MLAGNFDFETIKMFLKVSSYPLIFYYLKKNILSKLDIDLVLNAFLKSLIPAIIMIVIDLIIIGSYTSNRGFDRYDTSYGDIATLGLQINIIITLVLYNIIEKKNTFYGKNPIQNFLIFIILGFALIKISHGSSFAVFAIINTLFMIFKFRYAILKNLILFSTILSLLGIYIGTYVYSFYVKFFSREIFALITDGNLLSKTYLFHGRMGRWARHLELFNEEITFNKIFGGLSIKYPFLISHGPHNDFLRILYTTGYLGLLLYIIFLISVAFCSFKMKRLEDSFIILCSVVIIFLYSITLTPTTYYDLNIFTLTIISKIFFLKEQKFNRRVAYKFSYFITI